MGLKTSVARSKGNMAAEDDEDGAARDPRVPGPADGAPPVLSYDSGRRARLKTLKRLPTFEANLAAAKLEAAGVPAFVDDEYVSAAHPLLFSQVRLQVDEADFERAQAILDAPPPATSDDDRGEYVDEEYRCPRCHRKAVDLVPLSGRMKSVRLGCLGVLLLPVLALVLPGLLALDESDVLFPPAVILVWVLALAVLTYFVLAAKRRKRCRECAHEW